MQRNSHHNDRAGVTMGLSIAMYKTIIGLLLRIFKPAKCRFSTFALFFI